MYCALRHGARVPPHIKLLAWLNNRRPGHFSTERGVSGQKIQYAAGLAAHPEPVHHHLQPGDELDVPVAPLPEVRRDDAPATSAPGQNNEDTQVQQAGGFLASSTKGEAAASMARGMATGAAGAEIQQ
ncbi:hypothetical protein [Yokenella regensburgei]|uniref:hypothetical protein n=1 Tax=Yokenella regensburgei TaxID=158877 RepID=UPI003EDB3A73